MANKRDPYTCPHCGSEKYKSILKGRTRCCKEEIVRVNGQIYRELKDAPEWQIILAFVNHKRSTHELSFYEIPYGDSAYKKCALPAANTLLKKCGGDVDLALTVVDISFTDRDSNNRRLPTMFSLNSVHYFPIVFAKAKRELARSEENQRRQRQRVGEQRDEQWASSYAAAKAI